MNSTVLPSSTSGLRKCTRFVYSRYSTASVSMSALSFCRKCPGPYSSHSVHRTASTRTPPGGLRRTASATHETSRLNSRAVIGSTESRPSDNVTMGLQISIASPQRHSIVARRRYSLGHRFERGKTRHVPRDGSRKKKI